MVMMVASRGLSAVARRQLIEWCRANGLPVSRVAGPYLVDTSAGTISVHRFVVGDAEPAADFPELARDSTGALLTEVTTMPLQVVPHHALITDAEHRSQAAAA